MPAKEKKSWTVLCRFFDDGKYAMEFALQNPCRDSPKVTVEHVCSHCGKDWPIINRSGIPGMYEGLMPLHKYFKFASDPTYAELDYCCDATRADCEEAVSDG